MECTVGNPCFRKVAGYGLPGRPAKSFVARVTWGFESLAFRCQLFVDRYSVGQCANHKPLLLSIVVGVAHGAFLHHDWKCLVDCCAMASTFSSLGVSVRSRGVRCLHCRFVRFVRRHPEQAEIRKRWRVAFAFSWPVQRQKKSR